MLGALPPSANVQLVQFGPTPSSPQVSSPTVGQAEEQLGRGLLQKFLSVLMRDFVTHTVYAQSSYPPTPSPHHSLGTPYPLAHYINYDNFSVIIVSFFSSIISCKDPKSLKEAMKSDAWKRSMKEEIQALEDNCTWTFAPLPPGKRALGSQWV